MVEKDINSKEVWKCWKAVWFEASETIPYLLVGNDKKGNNP